MAVMELQDRGERIRAVGPSETEEELQLLGQFLGQYSILYRRDGFDGIRLFLHICDVAVLVAYSEYYPYICIDNDVADFSGASRLSQPAIPPTKSLLNFINGNPHTGFAKRKTTYGI